MMYTSVNVKDEWETPPEIFKWANEKYGPFNVDVCANKLNAKCQIYYGLDNGKDGLELDWPAFSRCWMNPPYSNVYPWIRKASMESVKGCFVAALLNADHTAKWYKDFIYDYKAEQFYPRVERIDIPYRVRFIRPVDYTSLLTDRPRKGGSNSFPSMLVLFYPR